MNPVDEAAKFRGALQSVKRLLEDLSRGGADMLAPGLSGKLQYIARLLEQPSDEEQRHDDYRHAVIGKMLAFHGPFVSLEEAAVLVHGAQAEDSPAKAVLGKALMDVESVRSVPAARFNNKLGCVWDQMIPETPEAEEHDGKLCCAVSDVRKKPAKVRPFFEWDPEAILLERILEVFAGKAPGEPCHVCKKMECPENCFRIQAGRYVGQIAGRLRLDEVTERLAAGEFCCAADGMAMHPESHTEDCPKVTVPEQGCLQCNSLRVETSITRRERKSEEIGSIKVHDVLTRCRHCGWQVWASDLAVLAVKSRS